MLSLRGHVAYGSAPVRRVVAAEDDTYCPHCGGSLSRQVALFQHPCFDDAAERIAGTKVQPGAWRAMTALRASFGHFVGRDYLLAYIRPKKGDDVDPKLTNVYLSYLRRALEPTPLMIEARWGAARWRLTWRDPAKGAEP